MAFLNVSLKQRKTSYTRRMVSSSARQAAAKIEASLKAKVKA